MNILIISPIFPLPLISGGHTRLYNIIKRVSSNHVVDFVSPITYQEEDYISELKQFCRNVVSVHISDSVSSERRKTQGRYAYFYRSFNKISGLLKGIPREVSGFYFPDLKDKLENLLESNDYDIIQVEFTRMAQYFSRSFLKYHNSVKVLTDYDLAFIPHLRRWECEKNIIFKIIRYIDYRMNRSYALKTWNLFDSFIVMSEIDRKRTLDHLPELSVHVVPNGVDLSSHNPLLEAKNIEKNKKLLFIGGALHYPNVDALLFLTQEVYPLILSTIKNISLTVVGAGWESYAEHLSHIPSIHFTGFVKDIRPFADSSTVLIAPIRIGGGTRLKILEAMAMGIPVVSTGVGCEGITVRDGHDILIAETPTDLTSRVYEVFSDADLRNRLTKNAYNLVKENYGWDNIALKMEKIYGDLVLKKHG